MNSVVRLQTVAPEQFPEWKTLRDALFSGLEDEVHEREMDAIHAAPDQHCFVAIGTDERLLGFVEVSLRNIVDGCAGSPVGYLEGLYVLPELRGHGLGRKLVGRAIDWFRSHGCSEIATDSEIDDGEAQAFWAHLGFEETWRVVQFRRTL